MDSFAVDRDDVRIKVGKGRQPVNNLTIDPYNTVKD
jgi:hypothetical protein